MEKLNKIVAATDLSRPALDAVRRAALLAGQHGAALELLHVIPHPFASDAWNEVRTALRLDDHQFRQATRRQLEETARLIEAETRISPTLHLAEGKAFAEIAERCASTGADLLVVGAHGENVLLEPFLGTTAHRVLRFVAVPVLLVKESSALRYERAVVATDFSRDAAEAARCARRLLDGLDLTLFHAYEVPFEGKLTYAGVAPEIIDHYRSIAQNEARERLRAFAENTGLPRVARAVRHGPAALRIREYAGDINASLIVAGAQGKGALQAALLGSVSLRLVGEARCDILLARASR